MAGGRHCMRHTSVHVLSSSCSQQVSAERNNHHHNSRYNGFSVPRLLRKRINFYLFFYYSQFQQLN